MERRPKTKYETRMHLNLFSFKAKLWIIHVHNLCTYKSDLYNLVYIKFCLVYMYWVFHFFLFLFFFFYLKCSRSDFFCLLLCSNVVGGVLPKMFLVLIQFLYVRSLYMPHKFVDLNVPKSFSKGFYKNLDINFLFCQTPLFVIQYGKWIMGYYR